MYNNFFKKILLVSCVVFLYSCDKDYNSIGGDLIGENHFDFAKYTSNVVAYNQKIEPIQSNNLNVNALGIFDNSAFGTTTASFATQIVLESVNPTIGKNPVIESVVLSIPYFSTLKSTDTNGDRTFQLDSIQGPLDGRIKLSVYESGYFMRDLDPAGSFKETQKYYTNQNADFDNVKVGSRLNNSTSIAQNDAFFFSAAEYKTTTTTDGKDVVTRVDPEMRLDLNAAYFKTKIIDAAASGKLVTNDVFKEYFRGLYFKVEKSGSSPSNMALLDFKEGKITVKYKEDTSDTDATRVEKSIVLKFTGNTVSLLEQSNTNAAYASATTTANINTTLGDEKLYLKGGEGSMAILEIFKGDELKTIRENGWLINEANLVFHLDATALGTVPKPNRIYLYDLNNNRPIVDYSDGTTGTNEKNGKLVFGGILNTDKTDDNTYKVRITNHVRNLIKNADSTNVKLGVVITEDINIFNSYKLRTANSTISQAPKASVMSPLGTILYGSKATVADDKRLKLEIYYTKPN
ncbi:DUF4270 domain-containing protein [Flavobacterium hiemivividum]|uniref:DUF4270 domain-containing protein n=1 Tax=Flavobacterium hiemivividum TaxID=2541734 RepID=A0A4R5D5Z4_9FLAO|nr:DUF4270 domain-containing protein [Flavobacterium hiemivividum]TDE06684.1 DUF4270 domain-containing protein [Flavobacterium hiemivividum]